MKVAIVLLAVVGLVLGAVDVPKRSDVKLNDIRSDVKLNAIRSDVKLNTIRSDVKNNAVRSEKLTPIKRELEKIVDTRGFKVRSIENGSEDKHITLREVIQKEMELGMNYTQCIYETEKKMLSCKGPIGEIECDSVIELGNSSVVFQMLGLSKIESIAVDAKPESVKYYLYPRKLDNSTYMNRTIEIDNKMFDLVLFYSEKQSEEKGIRVSDLKCYEKLVKLFSESVSTRSVEILSEIPVEVPLFGEILVRDAVVQKRWLWGYGWGGYGGWGWGGYGWGYPYYYYGK